MELGSTIQSTSQFISMIYCILNSVLMEQLWYSLIQGKAHASEDAQ